MKKHLSPSFHCQALPAAQHYIYYRPDSDGSTRPTHSEPAVFPNLDALDSLEDCIRDLKRAGQWEAMVEHICSAFAHPPQSGHDSRLETLRALLVEFQGDNPQLTIDAFSYATGLNVFGAYTLRDYAKRNAISPEGFSKRVDELRRRFQLDLPSTGARAA